MTKVFKIGDRVSWNSEAGRAEGMVIRVHRNDVEYKGHTHHASPDAPQYESSKTEHVAMHKGTKLTRLRDGQNRQGDRCPNAPRR